MSDADELSLYDAVTASIDPLASHHANSIPSRKLLNGASRDESREARQCSSQRSSQRSSRRVIPKGGEAEEMPAELGDYRIVREIGRGGMGVVYEARQLSLGRTIALKVLPFASVLDPKQVARFQNEAQAAAQLQHPNIVPVYGVGCDRGVHYYSMQFIDGQPLDQAIAALRRLERQPTAADAKPVSVFDKPLTEPKSSQPSTTNSFTTKRSIRHRSSIDAAVELVVQAAEALHHAHESGIVHRDIKPSNLLVDGNGKLWVADFGLARCQSFASLTAAGDIFGTLRYMSPEQATGQTVLVDHRSDIYALGVTLYELLTLRTPFHAPQRLELLRQIAHDEPPAPRQLNATIPLDLETVVLKCLAKSREDRYETAQAFANDLKCYLSGQPTMARRPSALDRMSRSIRRHSRMVGVAIAGLIMVLGVSGGAMVLLASAQRQTQQALTQSQRHLEAARRTVDDFNARLSEDLASIPGTESVRLGALQRASKFYTEFLGYAANDERWREDVAIATFKQGNVLEQLGDLPSAQNHYELALRRFEVLLPDTQMDGIAQAKSIKAVLPEGPRLRGERAMCLNNLALLLAKRGQIHEALGQMERAERELQSVVMTQDELVWRSDLIRVQANLGSLQQRLGETVAAYQWLTAAVDSARVLAAEYPEDLAIQTRLASSLHQLSALSKEAQEAETPLAEAVSLYRRLLAQQPHSPKRRSDLVHALQGWGSVQQELHHTPCARDVLEEASRLSRELVSQAPRVPGYRADLAAVLNHLGMTWIEEDAEQARECFLESSNLLAQAVALSPKDYALRSEWAIALNNQATAEECLKRPEAAMDLLTAALEEQETAFEASGKRTEFKERLEKHRAHAERVRQRIDAESNRTNETSKARSRS